MNKIVGEITLSVPIFDDQKERLEKLLPWYQGQADKDGNHPHENWTIEDALKSIIDLRITHAVDKMLTFEEWLQGFRERPFE